MTQNKNMNRNGFALVTALLLGSISILIAVPYVARVAGEYKLMAKMCNSTAALDLAEAGIEQGLWELIWNMKGTFNGGQFNGWTNGTDTGVPTKTILVNSFQTSTGQSIGDYDVTVKFNADKTYIVEGKGYVPNRTICDGKRTVRVKYAPNSFKMAIQASGNTPGAITLGVQDKIDSYNSTNGTYAATHTNSHGDIETNGSIVFGTQAKVYGDASQGPNYPFSPKPSNVYGNAYTLQAPIAIDPIPQETLDGGIVTVAAAAAIVKNINNNSDIPLGDPKNPSATLDENKNLHVLGGKTIALPGGTSENPAKYYFTSIATDTGAKINASGSGQFVQIYVNGGDLSLGTQTTMTVSGISTLYVGGNLSIGTQAHLTIAGPPVTSGSSSTIYVEKKSANSGNLSIIGTQGVLNLRGKTAIYANKGGDISIATQGDINILPSLEDPKPIPDPGQTTFYIDGGNINVSTQGDINNTGKPKDLSIYSSGLHINLTTQTDFFGAIYAPNAAVSLTTQGEIFGAVACKTISAGTQAAIHFDIALLNEQVVFDASNAVNSWQEI